MSNRSNLLPDLRSAIELSSLNNEDRESFVQVVSRMTEKEQLITLFYLNSTPGWVKEGLWRKVRETVSSAQTKN